MVIEHSTLGETNPYLVLGERLEAEIRRRVRELESRARGTLKQLRKGRIEPLARAATSGCRCEAAMIKTILRRS
jgi:hypothetical protein